MSLTLRWSLVVFQLFGALIFAETFYIGGASSGDSPAYWTLTPPDPVSSANELDEGMSTGGRVNCIAFSATETVYLVGQISFDETSEATYWTVASGMASNLNDLTGDTGNAVAYSVAFRPDGVGYIVGVDEAGFAVYWTVSTSGTVSSPTELMSGTYAVSVAFSSSGKGYVAGTDDEGNVVYWAISESGTISGPFELVGGESGGAASAYAVAVSPSGTAYIVGSTTSGISCYWTITSSGTASSANTLEMDTNSSGRGIAFLPSGAGMIVGQGGGNVSAYWAIATDGTVGSLQALPNGSGGGSSAYAVAFSSDQTAYIVGVDNTSMPVYWTVPLAGTPVGYNILDGMGGFPTTIAIFSPFAPNPPTDLSGRYMINDFGLLYEYCAVLKWTLSDSAEVAAYNIYQNGVKIATVSSSTNQYQNHDQNRSLEAVYSVTAVNGSGNESAAATITLN